ncbi:isocitrate dehydrogenase (NADP(+)) [Carnobacterium divergens]|uniref:NADP-dependent isocitrate dehydrogenase n=1 Tax=Carnobacterium divergens TaxID=2748 RepID=UPI00107276D6|nr:NADP-dependent isocitrate dehydrogenase [Carnobacterium divergens]TFJ43130.1 isocitrate dehydrogenase (NADP(+)) [Carnobacterium divergens]TFJ50283.1 isocitrate dehydrogenase (NADP(+)) [Carnobacterium divergens]
MELGMEIRFENQLLVVPDKPIIPFIEGDGIGAEIWRVAVNVFNEAVFQAYDGQREVQWLEVLAGEKAFLATGEWLPTETIEVLKEHLIAIKGPLTTPIGEGIRSINVSLRQTLDLYVCYRPVRYFKGAPSPLKHPEKTNMILFRENTEDIYAGIEFEAGSPAVKELISILKEQFHVTQIRFPETSAIGIKPVSTEGSQRLIRAAITYALTHQRTSVTFVHKGNIMKFTEGGFKKWGYDLAEEEFQEQVFTWRSYDEIKKSKGIEAATKAYQMALDEKKLIIKDRIADIFLQEIVINPEEYDVIATLNLNGDYISDALAAQVGGIGIAPGGNYNLQTGHGIFEATHGTAPEYKGLNKMNPSSVLLSGALLFEYLGWQEAAKLIETGIEKMIEKKQVTFDFHRLMIGSQEVSCSAFANGVIQEIKKAVQ